MARIVGSKMPIAKAIGNAVNGLVADTRNMGRPIGSGKYPFDSLDVGECFEVEIEEGDDVDRIRRALSSSIWKYLQRARAKHKKIGLRKMMRKDTKQTVFVIFRDV
jgi:hypothetical protein